MNILIKQTDSANDKQKKLNDVAEAVLGQLEEHNVEACIDKATNKYTKSQRGALHVWCAMCADTLNNADIECEVKHPFQNTTYTMPWTMNLFKENVYKFVLEALTGKKSTEKQSTVNPSDVAQVISKRYAENGLICPPWPSNR